MGYVLIDNRVAGGVKEEFDTRSCAHCQRVLKVQQSSGTVWAVRGAWCSACGGYRCEACAATGRCEPFVQQIDRQWEALMRRAADPS